MASRARFNNVDRETAEDMRLQGLDPYKLDESMEQFLSVIYASLPAPPVSRAARLAALPPHDGVDRISGLSDALLGDIVSRLPARDAARTALLATRWRGVWRSAPLVLADAHLCDGTACPPGPDAAVAASKLVAAVSRALASHPGPFRCVHLVSSRMGARQAQLRLWLRLLASRGVQELVLVNRPWPREVPLPGALFAIATLNRLYLGLWKFPDAAGLQGASFPHLRELGLCSVAVEDGDVDAIVARSPALEILNIQGSMTGVRLRLVSVSLRCVQVCASIMDSIAVVNAPRLERLILSGSMNPAGAGGLCTRIKIGNAPKLSLFGFLEPGKQVLEIRDTVIMAGINASASMMLTSVKVLSLHVCFGLQNECKMVPDFLRCFPNVEALHFRSEKCDRPTTKINLKFWEDAGPIVSVMFRIKVMTFSEFRGQQDELAFLQYFFESARVLKYAVIMMTNHRFTSLSVNEMIASLQNMSDEKWATKFDLAICGSHGPEGGHLWTFQRGQNFSEDDPFAPAKMIRRDLATHQQKAQASKRRN